MLETLEKLAAANINLLPTVEITTHFVFERDGFVALVERRGESFGRVGTAGLLLDGAIAFPMRRGDDYLFIAKGIEAPATAEQMTLLRSFQADLTQALA
jgi:hypothetical protein